MSDTRRELSLIGDDLLELIDRLEECAEDDESLSKPVNELIDKLTAVSEALEELAEQG